MDGDSHSDKKQAYDGKCMRQGENDLKKKIYVVKTGRKTGIYDEYKKCETQVKGFPGARFRGFDYRTEFEKEDENKEGSLRHAFMRAEKFMNDVRIGGLKLVYQGKNQDYMEEESWKKEGFLPFAEEIPDGAGNLQGEDENDDTDETIDGFVLVEDDGELPFATDVPSVHAEPESREEQETSPEEALPIYILYGGESGYAYTSREKNDLLKRGANGFINRDFCENELEMAYWDVCCQKVMNTLARRHQLLTYKTRKIFDDSHPEAGKIEFYALKLETTVDSEDISSILSDADRPNTKFHHVIGAEDAKDELRYYVNYLKKPKDFLKKSGMPPKGILLYGPKGTGKTTLARAMAGESDVAFFQTSAAEFKGPHTGESEANIKRIFERARKYAPAIIFIDEIDAIGRKRTGSENTHHTEGMLNALLTEMDGFRGADSNKPVFVLAATNAKVRGEKGGIGSSLDDALLRRFDNQIYVDLPRESEREQYILKLLDDRNITTVSQEAAHSIAERTAGKSLAYLKNVFEFALRKAIEQGMDMTDDDLLTALEDYNHGEKKEYTPDYYKRVAIHETGHAYVSYISGDKPSYITIESRGNSGGYMRHANQEDVASYTREELLARIRTALAGRAAEQVFYGKAMSLNTGASGDLRNATDIAFQIVCTFGMEGDQLIVLSKDEILNSALAGEYTAKVNEILKAEMKNAIEIIENAKDKIRKIADVLGKEDRLTGKQFEELMEADG